MSSSSSSSSSSTYEYEVFPSFRGIDVREKFLGHFLKELDRKSITTFLDEKIDTSESLAPVLKQAIKDSKIAIVIFSKNYASSAWCLNELLEIVKCKEQFRQIVVPVFYDLDPCDVRYQINEFGEVFNKTCNGQNRSEDEKQNWRIALTDVANLKGYHSLTKLTNEAEMIEKIANDVLGKLKLTPSHALEGIVGIEDHIAKMNVLMELTCKEVRTVGIWGPSGIGKTTIARALYNSLSDEFHRKIYIDRMFINKGMEFNSKGSSTDYNMKLHLQEYFLSELLDMKGVKLDHLGAVKGKLKYRKVLIFIDDLEDQVVLDTLAGGDEWFGPGSRIIVITKDLQMLKGHEIKYIYEVGIPSKELALQILCKSAFKQISPPDGFMELASEFAIRVGSLPLGLNVLGSSLRGKDKKYWVKILPTIRKDLYVKIEKTLRMSYEGLAGEKYKALFRHIACFFNGHEVKNIKSMVEVSGLDIDIGIEILVDKSLIHEIPSWNSTKVVEMHCLVQEMGKEVVRTQSDKLGKREFLIDSEDVCNLLKGSTGTEKVIGISLDLDETDKVKIDKKAFKRMSNLRFLKFYKTSLERKQEVKWEVPEKIKYFPDELKLLSWPGYPMKSLPSGFCPEYLVELRMPQSMLEKLWKGVKTLTDLKVIDLSESQNLEEIPDLSEATNLETLNLRGCSSLVQLPSSIENLNKLTVLNMAGCTKLEALPNGTNLQSLTRLILSECSKLKDFPNISSKIKSLIANNTAFQRFPSKLRLENLVELRMEKITSERLWEGVQPLTNLTTMVLSGSENLKEVPDLSMATSLKTLNLNDCSSIAELALSSVQNLNKLTTLEMIGCSSLVTLPTSINLKSLCNLNLNGCTQLKSFPDISNNISVLNLSQTSVEEVPRRIEDFSRLESMEMQDCKKLQTLPTGINLKSLYRLTLSGCSGLRSFPDFSTSIASLYLNQTSIEEVPPWIYKISSLEALEMWDCKELRCISPRVFELKNLDEVFFSHCEHLTEVRWPDCAEVEAEVTNNIGPTLISFTDCPNLNQETLIQQSVSKYMILPGVEVPDDFTHRSTGSAFTISLPHSSLSQQSSLHFKACVVVSDLISEGSETYNHQLCFIDIEVHCRFKDSHGNYFGPTKSMDFSLPQKYDHLIIFDCQFGQIEDHDESSYEQVEIQLSLVSTRLRLIGSGILMLMKKR